MELSTDLRGQIWRTQDWFGRVVELEWEVKRVPDPFLRAERALELGRLCEALVPDRERALSLYQVAWQATGERLEALGWSRRLSMELGRTEDAARLAELEHRASSDPSLLVVAGEAWLDAGDAARAAEILSRARSELGGGGEALLESLGVAEAAGEIGLEVVRLEREAGEVAEAEVAGRKLLNAALLVRRASRRHPRYEGLLRRAVDTDPRNLRAALLLEQILEAEERWVEYVELHEICADVAPSEHERVDVYRKGGTALSVRFHQARPSVRMLKTALAIAHEKKLENVPGHMAMLALLRNAHQASGELGELVNVCERALESALSDDEQLFVAALAGRTAWKGLKDPGRAKRFFSTVKSLVPDHPLVKKYERATGQPLTQVPRLEGSQLIARSALQANEERLGGVDTRRYFEVAVHEVPDLSTDERRRAERIPGTLVVKVVLPAAVRVGRDGDGEFRAVTRDLSEFGVFIVTENEVAPGSEVELTIRIPREHGWEEDVFDMRARVVRTEAGAGFGAELSDAPESYQARVKTLRTRRIA
jgi:tetratricopeptide (TPR) repeat protein